MSKALLGGLLVVGLMACASGGAKDNAVAPSTAPAYAERTLFTGTRIDASIRDSLSSRHDKAGDTLIATVSWDVVDGSGLVVIPAGSTVELLIGELEPATNKSQEDGKLALSVTSVTVRGQVYHVSANLEPVPHQLEGRGITAGEIQKVAVGAAAGAVVGQVIGKNTRGAVIGSVIGAGAGTIVAVQWASRDVVVMPGTPIVFTLSRLVSIATR